MIILDVDGCVCDNRNIDSFEAWESKFETFEPNHALIDMMTPNLHNVMFVTARNERYRERTMTWFHVHWPLAIERSMGFWFRPNKDWRPSPEVKSGILDRIAKAGYPLPTMAVDDIAGNITMFQERGIPTMQHLMPGAVGDHCLAVTMEAGARKGAPDE